MERPSLFSIWKNKKSGELYQVYDYTNEDAEPERQAEYPTRISYMRISDRKKWSRSLSDWHRSYEPHSTSESLVGANDEN